MTPKEKALELVDKFMDMKPTKLSDYSRIYHPTAKQCALIAVEEIIKSNPLFPMGMQPNPLTGLQYWEHVKQELEKL